MNQMITAEEVIKKCISQATFDKSKLKDSIIEAAEIEYIRPFLGKELYAEIRTQYKGDTLTALNKTLVNDYLKDALAYFVLGKALPFIMMDITSQGVMINNSEFASSGTDNQRATLLTETINIGENFLDKAREFLEDTDNAANYPLYNSGDNIDNQTNIIGGIILDSDETTNEHNE